LSRLYRANTGKLPFPAKIPRQKACFVIAKYPP